MLSKKVKKNYWSTCMAIELSTTISLSFWEYSAEYSGQLSKLETDIKSLLLVAAQTFRMTSGESSCKLSSFIWTLSSSPFPLIWLSVVCLLMVYDLDDLSKYPFDFYIPSYIIQSKCRNNIHSIRCLIHFLS